MTRSGDSDSVVLHALIVDDEPHVRENLRLRLKHVSDVAVVGEAGTGPDAVEALRDLKPDVVFLDVKMPGLTGVEVVRALPPGETPVVVFVTAHDEFAVDAFEVNAVDYLLKPIDEARFSDALDRVREKHASASDAVMQRRLATALDAVMGEPSERDAPSAPDRLVVKARGRVRFVDVASLRHVNAAGDYVELHTDDETHLMRETMRGIEKTLGDDFQRIHRSTIVNLSAIGELRPTNHGEYVVFLHDGTRLKLSRTYRDALEAALGVSL